ncbi:MAG: hypothetical protein COV67_05645 [Nitrospinae bacterium CG11_big_fil_rev_8_21_14_0_20_56_8]|nr:MAG: hypothetical protein COV67_05645 [Nitrospinae bacterium CG11_big_fil_rev_8_21_14_0_20_56_8]
MLKFALDIDKRDRVPLPGNASAEERSRETYRNNLFPYTIVRAGLDLAYKELDDILNYIDNGHQPPPDSTRQDWPADIPAWYRERFLWSAHFLDMEDLHGLLVVLIKAMDSFGTRQGMNAWHLMVLYDCVQNIAALYNHLLENDPAKARDINLSKGTVVDFDDFINRYWPHLDFTLLSRPDFPHLPHMKRKETIEAKIQEYIDEGNEPLAALEMAGKELQLEPATMALLRRDRLDRRFMEPLPLPLE